MEFPVYEALEVAAWLQNLSLGDDPFVEPAVVQYINETERRVKTGAAGELLVSSYMFKPDVDMITSC
jgi:hypothetical protein